MMRIIKSHEPLPVEDRPFFHVLFGQPGLGKTTVSLTAAKPILHLDFDRGAHRADLKLKPDIPELTNYAEFNDWLFSQEFEDFCKTEGYKTINLDTVGTMLDDWVAPWLISQNPKNGNHSGGLSLSGWGNLSTHFNAVKTRILGLGLNLVALCHAKEEDDGQGKQIRLAVKGGTTDIIYRSADMMGYVYMHGKKRLINYSPNQLHIGKNTAGIGVIEIPDVNSAGYDDFIVEKVNKAYFEKMKQKSLIQVEYEAKLESYRQKLSELESPEQFGAFFNEMKEEQSQAVKAQVKRLLGMRLKELKLKFDAASGKVVSAVEKVPFADEPKEVLSETSTVAA